MPTPKPPYPAAFRQQMVEPAQAVQAAGFVARHPEPVACEGRPCDVGLDQGVKSEL